MADYWWIVAAGALAAALLVWLSFPLRAGLKRVRLAEVRRNFHRQREWLEAKFLQLGMVAGRPDAPRWSDCEFEDDVAFARNRTTGELSAFVGVTIELEADPESVDEPSDFMGRFRVATAVFRFDGRHWETDGRAIFNLSPTQAIRYYHRELEFVGQEAPGKP